MYEPAHDIFVLIATCKSLHNSRADVTSGARGLHFGLRLNEGLGRVSIFVHILY